MPFLFITDLDLPVNPLNAELNPVCHLLALLGAHHIFHVSGLRVKDTTQQCTQVLQELTSNRKFNTFHGFLVFTEGIPPAVTLLKYTTLQIRKPAVNHDSEPVTSIYNSHNAYPSLSGFGIFVCLDSELHGLSEKKVITSFKNNRLMRINLQDRIAQSLM